MNHTPIAVASRSFSKHAILRKELTAQYSNVRFNDEGISLNGHELVSFLNGCQKAILALEKVDDKLLEQLPELRVISKFGVGLDSFDLNAMSRFKVKLAWTPGTNSRSVAELTLLLALASLRRFPEIMSDQRVGKWQQLKGSTLSGKTVGLIGLGAVGKELALLLRSFDVKLLAHDPAIKKSAVAQLVSLEKLLKSSDLISLHVPLMSSTRNLMNESNLKLMKKSALLINTSRGGIIDENALIMALDNGIIAAAALDVFSEEPPTNQKLLNHPKILRTPHIGGSTEEAILAMGRTAIKGLTQAKDVKTFIR